MMGGPSVDPVIMLVLISVAVLVLSVIGFHIYLNNK